VTKLLEAISSSKDGRGFMYFIYSSADDITDLPMCDDDNETLNVESRMIPSGTYVKVPGELCEKVRMTFDDNDFYNRIFGLESKISHL
jgi:hypothetical protein